MWEHLVENAAVHLDPDRSVGTRARTLLEESAPWWEDDVRTSNARLDLLDLLQRGTADLERWRVHLGRPRPAAPPVCMVRAAAGARRRGAAGDLAARCAPTLRAPVEPATGSRLDDDQLWHTVVLARRGPRPTPPLAGPRDDGTEAAGPPAGDRRTLAARFRRYGRLGEVWPLDLAAQLDRFHGRDARPALRAALEGWERIGHVPDAAVTHLSLAEQEAIHGDRDAARRHLAAGRAVAEQLDAAPLLARADALAERWAIGPRERRTDGVLTEREVEVLRLVAEGMTNGQIGVQLFMSPKTASVHVSHILAKLGAANRTEAAATARRQGLLG